MGGVSARRRTRGATAPHTAQAADRIGCLVGAHKLEDLGGIESVSRANQAAAFARISRSSFNCLFSLRRRTNSAFSSLVKPRCAWRWPRSSSSCLIQLRMHCAVGSNSFANSSALRPDRASSRICWRYSGGYGAWVLGISWLLFPSLPPSTKPGQLQNHAIQLPKALPKNYFSVLSAF